jgi:hypothetical protein
MMRDGEDSLIVIKELIANPSLSTVLALVDNSDAHFLIQVTSTVAFTRFNTDYKITSAVTHTIDGQVIFLLTMYDGVYNHIAKLALAVYQGDDLFSELTTRAFPKVYDEFTEVTTGRVFLHANKDITRFAIIELDSNFDSVVNDFTIAMNIKAPAYASYPIFDRGDNGTVTIRALNNVDGSITLTLFDGVATDSWVTAVNIFPLNTLFNLVITFSNGMPYLYIDGVLKTLTGAQIITAIKTKVGTISLYLYTNYFNIGEVACYDNVVASPSILASTMLIGNLPAIEVYSSSNTCKSLYLDGTIKLIRNGGINSLKTIKSPSASDAAIFVMDEVDSDLNLKVYFKPFQIVESSDLFCFGGISYMDLFYTFSSIDVDLDTAYVGTEYTATLQTLPIESGSQLGVAYGSIQRIQEFIIKFFNSYLSAVKVNGDRLSGTTLEDTLYRDVLSESPERENTITIVSDRPYPCNILCAIFKGVTYEE